ncbi:FAD-dependent tricarballylate dehydrogenase TcuA [Bacillus sp. sid0103]|uniref:FAD-dependent tricarballylate dehydrogenase TcuA n=1 Tax=Bacillus sp. sid0103 TaxID=2856337 RepID=UPI001C442AD3|nr:FAD-dependent tricarballylate dehydrogenase TcuA [Bacillus sp. sid0103]MBV7503672.1 FAD-dependent tricarballylate dehydrogenase TcuA [Bacillus sp. sid0103]
MTENRIYETDVVIVGAGNAAICAAIAARENGAQVMVLEKSPEAEKGGNSTFTHGSIRFAYNGVEDLKQIMPDLTSEDFAVTDFGTYTEEDFYDDMCRITDYRTDPELASLLTSKSYETMKWMHCHKVRWVPIYGRQAFKVDGKFKFWGGMIVESVGGGAGLVGALHEEAKQLGVQVLFNAMATDLIHDDEGVHGVIFKQNGKSTKVHAKAVILASGGFHANPEMRTRYLGPKWDLAKARGSRFNTGEGIQMALNIGAQAAGNWSGCHSVGGDRYLPEFTEGFQKLSYPFGILVNAEGKRFIDEGADFRNYTYAKYGKLILEQPGQFAWQVFDAKVAGLLRDEYRGRKVTKVKANTIEELAEKLEGVDGAGFLKTVRDYNEAVRKDIPFNPNIKDGRCTDGITVRKSNWANTLDEGPFEAYAVTCGITFTFGGLKINSNTEVQNILSQSIPGLYAAGEMVGGLFYFNYPGGAGLMAGAVYGKIAGENAAQFITRLKEKEEMF